jgi:CNT family concentrative nucleoside transporter
MQTIQSIAGIFGLLALAFAFSENHRAVSVRQAAVGLAFTIVLATLFLRIPQLKIAFGMIGDAVNAVAAATRAGTGFVFGYLGGGPLPVEL